MHFRQKNWFFLQIKIQMIFNMLISEHIKQLNENGVIKIRLDRVNASNRTHLYYLIDHGVSQKERFSGLAHVTEHACLIDEGRSGIDHFRWGCTCLSHMILYYETKHDIQWINKIKRKMEDYTVISPQSVEIAKAEVMEESRLLKSKTRLNEEVVRFVTEGRITVFAMGESSEIQKIRYQDVLEYWEYLNGCHHIYEVLFHNRQDVESAFQQILQSYPLSEAAHDFVKNKTSDEYLILSRGETCTLKLYIQIPPLKDKRDYVTKAFFECYLQRLFHRHLHMNISMEDKYFSKSEKFVMLTVPRVLKRKVEFVLSEIRACVEEKSSLVDMQSQYSAFLDTINQAISAENALDSINKYQNWLIYRKPFFSQEDMAMVSSFNIDMFVNMKKMINEGVKVVVTSSTS